jgi:hypothetical protein
MTSPTTVVVGIRATTALAHSNLSGDRGPTRRLMFTALDPRPWWREDGWYVINRAAFTSLTGWAGTRVTPGCHPMSTPDGKDFGQIWTGPYQVRRVVGGVGKGPWFVASVRPLKLRRQPTSARCTLARPSGTVRRHERATRTIACPMSTKGLLWGPSMRHPCPHTKARTVDCYPVPTW